MDPAKLAVWTAIGINRAIYEPSSAEILKRYLLKFSKGGKTLHENDFGLLDPEGGKDDATMHCGYFARFGEPAPQVLSTHAGTHL